MGIYSLKIYSSKKVETDYFSSNCYGTNRLAKTATPERRWKITFFYGQKIRKQFA